MVHQGSCRLDRYVFYIINSITIIGSYLQVDLGDPFFQYICIIFFEPIPLKGRSFFIKERGKITNQFVYFAASTRGFGGCGGPVRENV